MRHAGLSDTKIAQIFRSDYFPAMSEASTSAQASEPAQVEGQATNPAAAAPAPADQEENTASGIEMSTKLASLPSTDVTETLFDDGADYSAIRSVLYLCLFDRQMLEFLVLRLQCRRKRCADLIGLERCA